MTIVVPIPPKPQSRPRFTSRGGYAKAYEVQSMTAYKKSVALFVKQKIGNNLISQKIALSIDFYVTTPKYLRTRKKSLEELKNEQIWCDKRPDLDNYIKAILDACNGILYLDDGQVVQITAQKVYSLDPRTEIKLKILEEQNDNL